MQAIKVIILKKAILYIHGKGGSAQEAERYKPLCPGYDVLGLDYKAASPWEAKEEFSAAYDRLCSRYDSIRIIGNSIGAYFAMHALSQKPIERAYFISPVVDMARLIADMMTWANVTDPELRDRQEIPTSFGETLSWEYLCYARKNPVRWRTPTDILYAGNDHLTSYDTISAFALETGASLTVMPDGEHWFHTPEQLAFLDRWLQERL